MFGIPAMSYSFDIARLTATPVSFCVPWNANQHASWPEMVAATVTMSAIATPSSLAMMFSSAIQLAGVPTAACAHFRQPASPSVL